MTGDAPLGIAAVVACPARRGAAVVRPTGRGAAVARRARRDAAGPSGGRTFSERGGSAAARR